MIATKNPEAKTTVMLAGHVDEMGLIVHYIDDKGFLYFSEIGGVDPGVLPGARVFIAYFKGTSTGNNRKNSYPFT